MHGGGDGGRPVSTTTLSQRADRSSGCRLSPASRSIFCSVTQNV